MQHERAQARIPSAAIEREELVKLTDVVPGAVGIAARGALHRLRLAVDIDLVRVVAAVLRTALVRTARRHLAVAPVVRITPLARRARLPALERVVLGLLGEHAVLLVHGAADLAADDAAD